MITYNDLSLINDSAYKLANIINSGHYFNTFYYEFHEEVDPKGIYDCLKGLKAFQKLTEEYKDIFIANRYPDEFPAIIHIALKVGDEWFIAHDCGANFYLGYGPNGIIKLRQACAAKNVATFLADRNLDDWIKENFGIPRKKSVPDPKKTDDIQFEKIIKQIQYLAVDMQTRPAQYQGFTEENIRDQMLAPLNVIFKGRGKAEAKNRKGKTDISIGTKNGLNEHIFELKVWNGIKTLTKAINQLLGYISWHNNNCGIILFSYNENFTSVLKEVEKYLQVNHNYDKRMNHIENEFRFRLTHQTDNSKTILTCLTMINLRI